MKKIIIIFLILLAVICGGFIYIKYHFLKAKDFKTDNSKAKTILDLRPAIIAKLQQLVKDGSGGLYILSIEKIDPDLLSSKLDVLDGTISIDTSAMLQLDQLKKLPDDVFHIKFHSLHIDGIGINDLLDKRNIEITAAYLNDPVINIYHKARPYNKEERKKNDSLTVYQRLMGQMKKIVIDSININHGIFIIHDAEQHKRTAKFNDVTVRMNDVLIDSSTQYETNRFLFAKHATLETSNYVFPTPDSLYLVKLGKINLAGEEHTVTILNAQLQHRGSREEFEKKLPGRDEMYDVLFPKIVLSGVNWWDLVNNEKILSKKTDIYGGTVSIFYDKSLPVGPLQSIHHFPHQLVMLIPVPVLVSELKFHHLKVIYLQYNPETRSPGTAIFTRINGYAQHITNIPAEIKRSRYTVLSASGLFMNKVPLTARFKFDLLKHRTGQFSADVHMDTLDKNIINPITEPLGRFNVKSGQMQEGTVHLEGDNYNLHGNIDVRYTDLHLTPLKSDSANGGLKKSHLKSFFANIIFIKNANPQGTELRQPSVTVGRDHHENFVAYIWSTIVTGLLKTVGIPLNLVKKDK